MYKVCERKATNPNQQKLPLTRWLSDLVFFSRVIRVFPPERRPFRRLAPQLYV